jgi:hypothetical protein
MKTRSKLKGVPQGVPTTSFVEEVSKTLPTIQGTHLALQKQQLVKVFSDFDSDFRKVIFALSYLRDIAQEWFEPGISGLTNEPPEWFDN